jgi:hypothetical protein
VTYYYTVSAVIGAVESVPSGVAWATPGWLTADVAATSPTTSDFATSIATDSMGGAHVHYSFDEHIGNAVLLNNYYATNVPGPWSKLLVARTVWVSSSIALESGGTVHVGYHDFGGLKHAVYTAGTWTAEVADATGTCEASLALDSAGKVHIAYYSSAGGKTLRYVTNASGSWTSSNIESFASIGCYTPHKVSLGVDATGVAHVAYAGDSPDYGLKYATNSGGTWTVSTLDTGNMKQVSLAVDLNARVHSAYGNNLNQVKYAQNATGAWTVEVLGGLNHPALALDAAGKAHVSYIGGPSGGELTYATNVGGSWRTIPIDTVNKFAVTDTAISVDRQGKVHISYIRGSGIKYATNK